MTIALQTITSILFLNAIIYSVMISQFITTFIAAIFTIFLISAVSRIIVGAFIGSTRVHNKKVYKILIIISCLLFILPVLFGSNVFFEKFLNTSTSLLSGVLVYWLFKYSDLREAKKGTKRKDNRYMWENMRDSL